MANPMLDAHFIRLQNGHLDSFDVIYEQTKKGVYFLALSIVKDSAMAEDVSQETYLAMYTKLNQYQKGTNALAWILTIARNTALNHYRLQKREVAVDVSENEALFGSNEIVTSEETPTIQLAIQVLNQEEFQIVSLILFSEYKRREVAEILQQPIATITWKYQKALTTIRNALQEQLRKEDPHHEAI